MAVRFDAGADAYAITTGLPTSNVFTFTAWLRIAVDRNDYSEVISFGSTYMSIATDQDGTSVGMWDSGSYNGAPLGSTAFTVGTWYRVAGVVSGANATFYRSAAGAALSSTSVANYTSGTPTSMRIGDYWDGGGFTWNGNIAAFKLWNAALTAAEVEQELTRYTPARTANLLRFHPFVVPETTDYSGNGYTMTAGTATREDGPPIPWQMSTPRLLRPAPAGGGPVSGTATAPLGDLAATAAGVSSAAGTAAAQLGTLTATANGTPTIAGAAAAGFGSLTASAAGARIEPGTAAAPLGGLAATADGSVMVSGAATAPLGGLAATASGLRTVVGVASAMLGPLTASAAAGVTVSGPATATLGALAAAASGTVTGAGGGTADAPLGPLSSTAPGGVSGTGTATAVLGALAATAAGTPTVAGAATALFGGLVAQAAGQGQTATASALLGVLSASVTGVRVVGATAAALLGGLVAAASGATFATGTAAALLGALAAAGTVAPPVTKGSMTGHARPGPALTAATRQHPTLTGHTRPGPTMTEVT